MLWYTDISYNLDTLGFLQREANAGLSLYRNIEIMNFPDAYINLSIAEVRWGSKDRPEHLTPDEVAAFLQRIQDRDRLLDALFDQLAHK
jgi:hypothetical protein